MKKLNSRQQKFVELYEGNGTDAARRAGYSGNDNTLAQAARSLLRNPHIAEAIERRNAKAVRKDIADRQERQAFWTASLRNESLMIHDRLRASELLGKSEADFTDKHQVSFENDSDDQLRARYQSLLAKGTAVATFPESDE